MPGNTKRVFYVRQLLNPVYAEILATVPDIQLDKIEAGDTGPAAQAIIRRAHIYQITSSWAGLHPQHFANQDLLNRAPDLLAVSTNAAGYDTVDVAACTKAGVLVVNQSGGNAEAVAEHVLGMMLSLSKRIAESNVALRQRPNITPAEFTGHDIKGKTIGIVGLGNVGRRIAEICRLAFGMKILACDPHLSADEITRRGAEKTDLDSLLSRSDFISVNCPLTAETRGLIGAAQFARIQPHAYFITTARGGVCDEAALAQALEAGKLAGAGIDVWQQEPTAPGHPLMRFDNVLVSPHSAGVTFEARATVMQMAAEQVLAILAGKIPPRLLNPEVWPAYTDRFEKTFGLRPAALT